MPKPEPEVLLNPWDLKALGKKQSDCLHIDSDLIKPVPAISKAGFSSATLFGCQTSSAAAPRQHGEINVRSLQPNYQGTRDLSIKEYARLFDKFYDAAQGSRIDRMVAKNKMTQDPSLDARIDSEIERRALREPRAKYLSAALADKYGVNALAVTGAPPKPPQILGLAMVPAGSSGSHLPPELQTAQPDTHSSARVLELAQTLAESDRFRTQQAELQAKSDEDARRAFISRAAAPMPASHVFKTTTREQAQQNSNRLGQRGEGTPGPGKYDIRWQYWDRPPPNTILSKPCYKDEPTPQKQRLVAAAAERHLRLQQQGRVSEARTRQRPASAAVQGSSTSKGGSAPQGGQGSLQRPSSAAQFGLHRSSSSTTYPRANSGAHTSGDIYLYADREGDVMEEAGGVSKPVSAQQKTDGLHSTAGLAALYKDAHHVHGYVRPESPAAGTSSFKAVPRPPLKNRGGTEGTHLALKYYREGIDDTQRRPTHLVLSFDRQPDRPSNLLGAPGSTHSALGPGAYMKGEQPTSLTGRHVEANHKGIKHVPNFARMTSRPGSAPPGHTRADQVPAVSGAEAQGALLDIFGDNLSPSELLSLQEVQAKTQSDHTRFTLSPSPPQQQPSPRGIRGLGPDDLARFSSTGLAKPIPGGSFSHTTRAQEVRAMRLASEGRVIPPASAPLQKIRPMQAPDVIYEQVDPTVEGKYPRAPAWKLPPNRVAMSRQWISAAALAYV